MALKEDPNLEKSVLALDDERWIVRTAARILIKLVRSPTRVVYSLFGTCVALLAVDLIFALGWADKHAHFSWENGIGFYGAYGFVACVVLVLISKHVLRPAVMRDEDHYD